MSTDRRHVLGREGEILELTAVRIGVVGCGGHSYRNVLPALRLVPDAVIVAFCDLHLEKAELFARDLGADAAAYDDITDMLDTERLDAVVVVVGFDDESGEPLYPPVVEQVTRRGIPVWMEKPPAADASGVARMSSAAQEGGTFVQVGFKKVFSPAVDRLARLIELDEFGPVTRYTYDYDVDLPADVGNLRSPAGRRFLDDYVHVASVIDFLVGPPASVQTIRGLHGAGIVIARHTNGAIGTITLSNSTSGLSPVERLEITGVGANAVLENGAYLKYYPPGTRGPYGTSTSYLPPIDGISGADHGPRFWEPEFSLGNMHGSSHFLQGYFHQMQHFVRCVRSGTPPDRCGLDTARRVMEHMDALVGPFGEWRSVAGQTVPELEHTVDVPEPPMCPRTRTDLVLKDGWNYVCRQCGRTRSGKDTSAFDCSGDG